MQLRIDFWKSGISSKCIKTRFLLGYMRHSVYGRFFGVSEGDLVDLRIFARITLRRAN
jgi:hypothetical protein